MKRDYAEFLTACAPSVLAEKKLTLPSELELQSLFFAGHFGRDFESNEGQRIHIVQFGEWNHGPGPDFLHCAIEVDGLPRQGPVELDSRPEDWEGHGHATNPEFDEVILHLTVEPSQRTVFTRNSRHQHIPQACIPAERLHQLLPASLEQAPVTRGRCYQPLREMPLDRVEDLLKKAALHRARHKARRFHCVAETHGYSEALWQALASALGYHQNRLAMTLLAQRAQLSSLRNLSPLDRTALLFGLAGFLTPDLPEAAPPESRQWLQELWSSWWKSRPCPDPRPLPWKFAAIRPGNHPQRRLAALAASLSIWPTLEKQSRQAPTEFARILTALNDPFWNEHYTLTSKRTAKPIRLFGKERAREFLINILHPLRLDDDPQKHWPAYATLSGGTPPERVQRAAYRLFGDRPEKSDFLKKGWHQQALLQIYQDFCLQDHSDCAQCPFPEQLRQW
jgi:hypothetical protein